MGAGSVAALVVLRAPSVSAQTLGDQNVAGTCPTAEQVATSLAARTLPAAARDYRLTVRSGRGYTEFVLGDRSGQVRLHRFVASDDCAAMADVVALVTEAFFVELVTQGHPPDDTSAIVATRPAPAAPPVSETRADTGASPATPKSAAGPSPSARAAPVTPPTAPAAVEKPASSAAPHPTPERAGHNVLLTLGAGVDAYDAFGAVAPFGQLGAAVYFAGPRLALELHGVAEAAVTLQSAPDRVLRSESRGALRVERYFGTTTLFVPWVGFGAAVSRSRALDLAGPVRHLPAPLVEAGLLVRAARTSWLVVNAELGCHVLLNRERYIVLPDGHIGDGPVFGCHLGPNLSWSSPAF